jgi:hypothetical protein
LPDLAKIRVLADFGQILAKNGKIPKMAKNGKNPDLGEAKIAIFRLFFKGFLAFFGLGPSIFEGFWPVFDPQKSRWHFFGKIEKSRYFETKSGVASVLGLAGYLSRFCQIKWS